MEVVYRAFLSCSTPCDQLYNACSVHVCVSALGQGLWYQDFPPKTSDSPTSSEFESSLGDYLTRLQLPGSWATDVAVLVAATDWSAARAALVASVPGYHSGVWAMCQVLLWLLTSVYQSVARVPGHHFGLLVVGCSGAGVASMLCVSVKFVADPVQMCV